MELDAQFENAVDTSKKLAYKPSNDRLLQLYGFYKQATIGDCKKDVSNPLNLVARAKHDAWANHSGMESSEAKQKYVELVGYLSNKSKQTLTT